MDIQIDGEVRVALSERNLRDLLGQVESDQLGAQRNDFLRGADGRGGAVVAQLVRSCAQPQTAASLAGDEPDHIFLRVVVERDDVHYGDRTPGPGTIG